MANAELATLRNVRLLMDNYPAGFPVGQITEAKITRRGLSLIVDVPPQPVSIGANPVLLTLENMSVHFEADVQFRPTLAVQKFEVTVGADSAELLPDGPSGALATGINGSVDFTTGELTLGSQAFSLNLGNALAIDAQALSLHILPSANQNQTAPGQANSFEITLLVDSLSDGRFRVADFGPIRLGVAGLDVAGVTFDGEINIDIFATPVAVPELDDSQTARFSNITVEFLLFEDDWNATTQIHAVKLLNGPDGVKNFGGAAGVGFTFDGFEIFADEAGLFPDANDPTTALVVAHGIVLEIITAGQFTASALDLTLQVSDLFTVEVGPLASGDRPSRSTSTKTCRRVTNWPMWSS